MAAHHNLGRMGESWARDWLTNEGFCIIDQNWRFSHAEVDIIASRKNVLHFVEVKCRTSDCFGFPEESVDEEKVEHLLEAAEEYIHLNPEWSVIQFDILSIMVRNSKDPDFCWLEDIYL